MNEFIVTNYREKQFGDKYLLTSDSGRYIILSEEEYDSFRNNIFTQELIFKLREAQIIVDENNFSDSLVLKRNRFNDCFIGPSLHIIVVTLKCNMSCKYCQVGRKYHNEEGYNMNSETARKTVDMIFQTHNENIVIEFQGGEPTLNLPVIKEIIEYAKEKNKTFNKKLSISMVTNMTTMNDEMMNYFIKEDVDVCTSLDGPENVHIHNRLYEENNHKQVIHWINKFNNEYKRLNSDKRMSALVTLTNYSLNYYKEIIQQYIDLGIEVVHLRRLTKLGFAKSSWDKISYTSEEYLEFWKKSVEYIKELQEKGIHINERFVLLFDEKLNNDVDPNYMDLRSPCGAGIGQVAYDLNGDIYSCDEARMMKNDIFKLGNVFTSSYKDIMLCDNCNNLIHASTLDGYDECIKCVYKPFCGVCPVLNFSEKNTLFTNIKTSEMCKENKFKFDWIIENYFLK